MDRKILEEYGVHGHAERSGFVDGFTLVIGNKATLIPEKNGRSYGMVMSMPHSSIETLYAGPGLEAYKPEAVVVQTTDGSTPALCYNLLTAPAADELNREYTHRLKASLRRLQFPLSYIDSLPE